VGATIARRLCETFGPKVRPDVAVAFAICVEEGDVCASGRAVKCGLHAVDTARADPSRHDECTQIAADCADVAPEITETRCEFLFGAFTPAARPDLAACLHGACSSGSFGVCLP
jgi:hypothetical protein